MHLSIKRKNRQKRRWRLKTSLLIDKKKSDLNRGPFIDKTRFIDEREFYKTHNKHKRDNDKLLTRLAYRLLE